MSRDDPQWERAHQSWELVIGGRHVEVGAVAGKERIEADRTVEDGGEPDLKAIFRILRVKRSERTALVSRLPGVVRRGARVDLEPLERALREAGVPCVLRRRAGGDAGTSRDGGDPRTRPGSAG
jgi:hypothetical protein